MATGGDADSFPPPGRRAGGPRNEAGLRALGQQIDQGTAAPVAEEPVANESGLRALGQQIDQGTGAGGPPPRTRAGGGGRPPRPPRRTGYRRNGKPRWSVRRKVLSGLAALIILVAAVAGAGYAYVRYEWDKVHKGDCTTCVLPASAQQPFNVLIVGSDSRAGDTGSAAQHFGSASEVGGQRSDTIKILRVNPKTGSASILSIPRDTYVDTSGLPASSGLQGSEKINASFNNGPNALIETIKNTFGITISHYVVIDFNGVIDSVNALGGIKLDFKYPVRDYNTGTGVNESGLNIPDAGCQTLNGNQVLSLSRSRYYQYYENGQWISDESSDLGRIIRQNVIIEAMIKKARSTYNPLTLHSFIDSVVNDISVDSNMSLGLIYDLAERYHAFSPSSLATWTLPTLPVDNTPQGDVEVVNTQGAGSYVNTLAEFLGTSPGAVTTPPLDADGNPITVPAVTTTTAPSSSSAASSKTSSPPASSSATTTTVPSFDPSLC